jgi:hypothetical protein
MWRLAPEVRWGRCMPTLAGHLRRSVGANWGVSMVTEAAESVKAAIGAIVCRR